MIMTAFNQKETPQNLLVWMVWKVKHLNSLSILKLSLGRYKLLRGMQISLLVRTKCSYLTKVVISIWFGMFSMSEVTTSVGISNIVRTNQKSPRHLS